MTVLQADLTLIDGHFRPGLQVVLKDDRIVAVEPAADGPNTCRLAGRALIPGLINSHSHAFQRAIRGRTEYRHPDRPEEDFWTWRELMYQAASELSPEQIESVSAMAFLEMICSGITSVGEFHYLHHQSDGRPYQNRQELALRVASAAEQTGLRLVLLRVAYARAGFQVTPNPRQARFCDSSPERCLEAVEELRKSGLQVGLAPHSVRAVPREWLTELGAYAQAHGLPLHMHVCEQPREIEECLFEHGHRPVQLVNELGLLGPGFTGVHAIHLADDELAALGSTGANVCSCPTTERNLGDGVVRADLLLKAGASICLGTDSQCQIDLLEDARQLEYHLRLTRMRRALLDPLTGPSGLARTLMTMATEAGARALKLDAGRIAVGALADLVSLDLNDPAVAGSAADDLPATVVFGLSRAAIRDVWVGGRRQLQDGRHPHQEEIVTRFSAVMKALRGG